MKTRKEQKHPDITWRGHVLVQWYGAPRGAELKSDGNLDKPRFNCKVSYEKDKPVSYQVNIYHNGLSVSAYAKDPLVALEDARKNILDLAEFLK